MVKIRLTRQGTKKRPIYRIIAIDERKPRDGRPLEYRGAVGRFDIGVTAAPTRVAVGDPITVTLRVTDSGTPELTYDETVTITVNNLNETPTDIAITASSVDENTSTAGGYSVGTLSATDIDAGESFSYMIIGGPDAAVFSIGGGGSDELILTDECFGEFRT